MQVLKSPIFSAQALFKGRIFLRPLGANFVIKLTESFSLHQHEDHTEGYMVQNMRLKLKKKKA